MILESTKNSKAEIRWISQEKFFLNPQNAPASASVSTEVYY